jgi:hypothetical protein
MSHIKPLHILPSKHFRRILVSSHTYVGVPSGSFIQVSTEVPRRAVNQLCIASEVPQCYRYTLQTASPKHRGPMTTVEIMVQQARDRQMTAAMMFTRYSTITSNGNR